jgi:vacuolar-type H+-ATPase subunit E/Vma4
MSLADLTEKITLDAQASQTSIQKEAEAQSAKIVTAYAKKQFDLKERFVQETEAALERNLGKVTQGAQREAKQLTEKVRRKEVEAVFSEALSRLITLGDAEYMVLIMPFIKALPHGERLTIKTSENRIEATNKCLKKAGVSAMVESDSAITGGFIAIGDTFEYNATFAQLIAEKMRELEVDVAQTLFS